MNRTVLEACNLVCALREALACDAPLDYRPFLKLSSLDFIFKNPGPDGTTASRKTTLKKAFEICRSYGVSDFQLSLPVVLSEVEGQGFSDAVIINLFCLMGRAKLCFASRWDYDEASSSYAVTFEQLGTDADNTSAGDETDNSIALAQCLGELSDFAEEAGEDSFQKIFSQSLDLLTGSVPPDTYLKEINSLKAAPARLSVLAAALHSDVFGGAGSFNDVPYKKALENGLLDRYRELYELLCTENRRALMYAVNSPLPVKALKKAAKETEPKIAADSRKAAFRGKVKQKSRSHSGGLKTLILIPGIILAALSGVFYAKLPHPELTGGGFRVPFLSQISYALSVICVFVYAFRHGRVKFGFLRAVMYLICCAVGCFCLGLILARIAGCLP